MSRIQNKSLDVYLGLNNITDTLSVFKGFKALTLSDATFLHVGYSKPIHSLYIDLNKVNINESILVIEKWDGSAWHIVDRQDESFGLKKSGHIFTNDFTEEAKQTLHGKEQFWMRISTIGTTSELEVRYLNLVFNNLEDLLSLDPAIELYYPMDGETNTEIRTFLGAFMSARETMLHWLNQSGKYKYNGTSVALLTQWDIYNVNELRMVSKYLSMYTIFISLYDNKEDVTRDKAMLYLKNAQSAFDAFRSILTLDTNDSGRLDQTELDNSRPSSVRLGR